jgi:hypothetical protein
LKEGIMSLIQRAQLENFVGNFQYRMKLLAQTRVHTDRLLATRHNVFEYIEPNENALSDLIRDLLDPAGKHGQGDTFLREFINIMKAPVPSWNSCSIYRENVTSLIEHTLRRIDLLIDFGNFGIAIENKPWAGEQKEQIGDYVTHLERRYAGRFLIIYLSPAGSEPTSIDPSTKSRLLDEGKLLLVAYTRGFREWLSSCYRNCAAEKIRHFLLDFVSYVDSTFAVTVEQLGRTSEDE